MPKVIRLTSTEQNGVFDNDFKDDIIIRPNSRIALQNIVVETEGDPFVVNANNDTIEYQLTISGGEQTAAIQHGSYAEANQDPLLSEISFALNKAVPSNTGKSLGLQWKCQKSTTGVIEIGYKTATSSGVMDDWELTNVRLDSGVYERDGGTYQTADAFMHCPYPFAKGGSQFRIQTSTLEQPSSGGPDTQGIVIGLVENDPNTFATTPPTIDDIVIGIRATHFDASSAGHYWGIVNGLEIYSEDAVSAEDGFICIEAHSGSYHAGYYADSTDSFNEVESASMVNHDLYMVIWFFGADDKADVNATTIWYTADPCRQL